MTAPWMPPLIHSISLRRQQRRDGGYDMVPAYTVSEMEAHGQACARAALEQAAKVAGPEDSYRDEWFSAKTDSVAKILALAKEIT